MPITATEWEQGQIDPAAVRPDPSPTAGATPRDRVCSFLRANDELAFTRAEVLRGSAARDSVSPAVLGQTLAQLPNQLSDLAADFIDGGIDVDGLSAGLEALRAEGVVACRRIERGDGELAVYYRSTGQ